MTKLTFELDNEFIVTSRGQSVAVNINQLHADILADVFGYGLKQIVADSVASAPRDAWLLAHDDKDAKDWNDLPASERKEWTKANTDAVNEQAAIGMDKTVQALYEGIRTVRTSNGGEPEHYSYIRATVRKFMKDANRKTYEAFDAKTQRKEREAFLLELWEGSPARDKIEAMALADLEKAKKDKAEKAKLAAGMDMGI